MFSRGTVIIQGFPGEVANPLLTWVISVGRFHFVNPHLETTVLRP